MARSEAEVESDARMWRRQFDREAKARALIDQILDRNGGQPAWLNLTKLTVSEGRSSSRWQSRWNDIR